MYFPILTAKQNEVFALSELPDTAFSNTIPILIPPNSKNLISQIIKLVDKEIYFILVINPQKSSYPKMNVIQHEFIQGVLKDYMNYSIAFILDDKTSEYDISDFFASNPKIEKSLMHFGKFSNREFLRKKSKSKYDIYLEKKVDQAYINDTANGEIVLIEDGFKKQDRNTDYPSDSKFSDLIFRYEGDGIFGFGDFTIVGQEVSDTGGSPFAIALHLSQIKKPNFDIYHFVSDDAEDRKNQAGKFTQALNKLIKYIDANPMHEGSGIKDFRDRHADGHYPGLGVCKRMSIKNHIEQVNNELSII